MSVNELDFSKFEEASRNPQNQMKRYLAEGRKIVGCYHMYTPEPLIYAAGAIPFGMWGEEMETQQSKRYFPSFICGIMHTNLELGITGMCGDMSAVVIPLLCDSLICASQNWKCAVSDIPAITVAYPHSRKASSFAYLKNELRRVSDKLCEILNISMEDSVLREAIRLYNRHHDAMRRFVDLVSAHPAEITPWQRNSVLKSAYFMDKAEHLELLLELNRKLERLPSRKFRGIRVLTTGMICDSPDLLNIFHANKVSIAVDEVAHESRQFRVDYDADLFDPLDAIVRQYMDMFGCSVLMDNKMTREGYILSLVKKYNVDGVIILMTKFCDPEEYDYPLIKEQLDAENIPVLSIETDMQTSNYGQAHTAVQTFQEMIRL